MELLAISRHLNKLSEHLLLLEKYISYKFGPDWASDFHDFCKEDREGSGSPVDSGPEINWQKSASSNQRRKDARPVVVSHYSGDEDEHNPSDVEDSGLDKRGGSALIQKPSDISDLMEQNMGVLATHVKVENVEHDVAEDEGDDVGDMFCVPSDSVNEGAVHSDSIPEVEKAPAPSTSASASESLECPHCNRVFTRPEGLSRHLKTKICTSKSARASDFYFGQSARGPIYFGKEDVKKLREKKLAQNAGAAVAPKYIRKRRTGASQMKCPHCNVGYSSQNFLYRHLRENICMLNPQYPKIQCVICGQVCENKTAFSNHVRAHDDQQGDTSGVSTTGPYELGVPSAKKSLTESSKGYEDGTALALGLGSHKQQNVFVKKGNLEMKAEGEKVDESKCGFCCQTFKQKHHLIRHLRAKVCQKNPYYPGRMCNICGLICKSNAVYSSHMKTHKDVQLFGRYSNKVQESSVDYQDSSLNLLYEMEDHSEDEIY